MKSKVSWQGGDEDLARNVCVLENKTSVSHQLPVTNKVKVLCFRKYVINLQQQYLFLFFFPIANADQICTHTEMPYGMAVNITKGENYHDKN